MAALLSGYLGAAVEEKYGCGIKIALVWVVVVRW